MQTNKTKKAFGLLEALIAIGVFGVTIVIGLSLIVKSLKVIKDNQTSDQAASFMVASLEYIKSPLVSSETWNSGDYYKVNLDPSTNEITGIEKVNETRLESSCEDGNRRFLLDIDGPDSNGVFCNQISVSKVNPSDPKSDFLIESIVLYQVGADAEYKKRQVFGLKSVEL
jgi:type II secretory pathway pseudopilin PulG